jgi:hypothetical protein
MVFGPSTDDLTLTSTPVPPVHSGRSSSCLAVGERMSIGKHSYVQCVYRFIIRLLPFLVLNFLSALGATDL